MNISLVFLPAKDIATFVAEGNVDLGITGEDIIAETVNDEQITVEGELHMGKCRLCLQAPADLVKEGATFFSGKRVVTSFPNLTKRYFDELDAKTGLKTRIKYVSGSVEAACGLGLAEAVVDLVETGTTMYAAGLDIVDTVMHTQTVLISNKKSTHRQLISQLVKRVQGWLTAMSYNMIEYNIPKDALEKAKKITPGIQAPTVKELSTPGWLAVNSLVKVKDISTIMDELVSIGATGIVATEIKNCRI